MSDFRASIARAGMNALKLLGSTVRYTPAFAPGADVPAIFDRAYQPTVLDGAVVANTGPQAWFLLADLRERFGADYDPERDTPTVTVDGAMYALKGPPEPDSMGGVLLRLTEA